MTNPFDTEDMAEGYANCRPAVHPSILERVRPHLPAPVRRALDVGCGAGLSTRALYCFADQCIGMDPVEAMLQWTPQIAPESDFVVGAAEMLPVAAGSVDLMTAAGSLNYVNLGQFFLEAARVLAAAGMLVIYDFSPGKSFHQRAGLEEWFSQFQQRYPPPPSEARVLNPTILAQFHSGFEMRSEESLEVTLALSPRFYLDYMMTETNVAFAVRNGVPHQEIRSWCEDTLGPLWDGSEQEVVFRGYFACMTPMLG
ncbi:MAG: class I SAM-dependent methyltransferase [Bryobacteraceae bacterium]